MHKQCVMVVPLSSIYVCCSVGGLYMTEGSAQCVRVLYLLFCVEVVVDVCVNENQHVKL